MELQKQKLEEIRLVKEASEKELEEVLEVSRGNTQAIRDALEAEAASEKQALIEGNLEFALLLVLLLLSVRDNCPCLVRN